MIEAGTATWKIAGFIDDNLQALDNYDMQYRVLDTISNHVITQDFVYICAIGDTAVKKSICERFKKHGAKFINIIHPSVRLGRANVIGIGNVLCPNAVLTENVTIKDFVFLNCHTNCGHDSVVEKYATISVFCDITGYVKVDEGAFLGSHASVCPGLTVGAYSKIGAGACVISDIPEGVTAVGVPARVVKHHGD